MKVVFILAAAVLLLALPLTAAAAAADNAASKTKTTTGQVTIVLTPFLFHPVFTQTGNTNSSLVEFSAYDNSSNPTNATSIKTTSKNTNLTVPVYALIKGLKAQVGTMTVSATGTLSFLGF